MDQIEEDVAAIRGIPAIPSILDVVHQTTGMGFVAVARVTETRWVACEVLDNVKFGLEPGGELPVKTTICSEVRAMSKEVVIDHVADDPDYAQHRTPAMYGFQSYVSIPIILRDGSFFGTLCAIDPQPRKMKGTAAIGMFRLFAQLIAFHLDAHQQLNETRADLLMAQKGTELREQFIAVLGHDLRNPLASIQSGTRLLAKQHEDQASVRILRHMGESVSRISGLVDNLMDFARGRLGGGITIEIDDANRIEPTLAQVINEMKAVHPDREIISLFELSDPLAVDHGRFSQMVSNLLGNAITHGAPDQPVVVSAAIDDGHFELAISNGGEPISEIVAERLFQPFYRGEVRSSMQGLGLGLYIASQIAQAHGGTLGVKSDDKQTTFTFRMPVA